MRILKADSSEQIQSLQKPRTENTEIILYLPSNIKEENRTAKTLRNIKLLQRHIILLQPILQYSVLPFKTKARHT